MTHLADMPFHMPAVPVNYFDAVVVVWLISGLVIGRKRGMSQELLPMAQWLAIAVLAGLYYHPVALLLRQYARFEPLLSNLFAYVLIGFGIHLLYLWIKDAVGEKLVGSDIFGRKEYYLGMVAGTVRFACMLIVFCALMNARIVTQAELARTEKMQEDNFSDIRLPTFGTIQQAVLFHSFTGNLVEDRARPLLIATTAPPQPKGESIAQRDERLINDVLTGGKR